MPNATRLLLTGFVMLALGGKSLFGQFFSPYPMAIPGDRISGSERTHGTAVSSGVTASGDFVLETRQGDIYRVYDEGLTLINSGEAEGVAGITDSGTIVLNYSIREPRPLNPAVSDISVASVVATVSASGGFSRLYQSIEIPNTEVHQLGIRYVRVGLSGSVMAVRNGLLHPTTGAVAVSLQGIDVIGSTGGIRTLLVQDEPLPGSGGVLVSVGEGEFNSAQAVAAQVTARIDNQLRTGIFTTGPAGTIGLQGAQAPEDLGTFGIPDSPHIDSAGNVIFVSQVSSGPEVLWHYRASGGLQSLIVTGRAYPTGDSTVTFQDILYIEHAANGDVIVEAQGVLGGSFFASGLWRISGLKDTDVAVTFAPIILAGQTMPDGAEYYSANSSFTVSSTGQIAFQANVLPPGEAFPMSALYAEDTFGQLNYIARAGAAFQSGDETFTPSGFISIHKSGGDDGRPASWDRRGNLLFWTALAGTSGTAYFRAQGPQIPNAYYWSGNAGTNNWHSVVDGISNWENSWGNPVDPPGDLGTEIVYVFTSGGSLIIDAKAVSVNSLSSNSTLVVQNDLKLASHSFSQEILLHASLVTDGNLSLGGVDDQVGHSEIGNGASLSGSGSLALFHTSLVLHGSHVIPFDLVMRDSWLSCEDLHFHISLGTEEDPVSVQVEGSVVINAGQSLSGTFDVPVGTEIVLSDHASLGFRLEPSDLYDFTSASLSGNISGTGVIRNSGRLILKDLSVSNTEADDVLFTNDGRGQLIISDNAGLLMDPLKLPNVENYGVVEQLRQVEIASRVRNRSGATWNITSIFLDDNGLLLGDFESIFSNEGGKVSFKGDTLITMRFDNMGIVDVESPSNVRFLGQVISLEDEALVSGDWRVASSATLSMPGRLVTEIQQPAALSLGGQFPEYQPNANHGELEVPAGASLPLPGGFANGILGELKVVGHAEVAGDAVNQGDMTVEGTLEVDGDLENEGTLGSIMTQIDNRFFPGVTESSAHADVPPGILLGGTLRNSGVLEPGGSATAGVLPLDGDLTLETGGLLRIDIGGATARTMHDQVYVTGVATLGGTLHVSDTHAYVPMAGERFPILRAGSVTGTFSSIRSDGAGRVRFVAEYSPDGVDLIAEDWRPGGYGAWADEVFANPSRLDPDLAGGMADPDNDLLPNLLEYVMGTNPHRSTSQPLQFAFDEAAYFRVPLADDATDVAVTFRTSTNLYSWAEQDSDGATYLGNQGAIQWLGVEFDPDQPFFLQLIAKVR